MAYNMRWILTHFEKMSGMCTNYHKSELIPMNLEEHKKQRISEVFRCPEGTFPIKDLWIPLHHQKLRRKDLQPLIDKILRRIVGWGLGRGTTLLCW